MRVIILKLRVCLVGLVELRARHFEIALVLFGTPLPFGCTLLRLGEALTGSVGSSLTIGNFALLVLETLLQRNVFAFKLVTAVTDLLQLLDLLVVGLAYETGEGLDLLRGPVQVIPVVLLRRNAVVFLLKSFLSLNGSLFFVNGEASLQLERVNL